MGTVEGLSPHRRGNLRRKLANGMGNGSIPAQAGEPGSVASFSNRKAVYPRTGGGTAFRASREIRLEGLSPHRRGNRGIRGNLRKSQRSIPAQAGEPIQRVPVLRSPKVYPRTGGGTRA